MRRREFRVPIAEVGRRLRPIHLPARGGLLGPRALLTGNVRGFAVTCIPVADPVAAVSRRCTALVGYSPAGTATAWSMKASRNRCATVG